MVGLKFEGFLDNITPRQREYIESVIVKLGYNDAKVTVEPVGKVGDNYGADVRRIIVENGDDTLKIVAKIAPAIEQFRKAINIGCIFINESLMYSEILPKYTDLEKQADIPESERLMYAKCYGCLTEEPNEVILLEDLKVKGFNILNKFKSLSDDAVKLILKNLAALHSLSYVLKAQEPESFNTYKGKFATPWDSMEESETHLQQMEDGLLSVLTDDKCKKHLVGKIVQMTKHVKNLSQEHRELKSAAIMQGDSWTNNFMFQHKDDKLITCCMIDYQLVTVNSPAADLGYMIFNCTDHETRMKYIHEWLDYYHSQLDKYLNYHGINVDHIFPKGKLDADMKAFGKLSLAQGVMISSIILREDEDAERTKAQMSQIEDVMDSMVQMFDVSKLNKGTIEMFKSRLEGLVDSHLALGYIE